MTTPTDLAQRYFATWAAHDFDAFEALLADDVSFRGPLGTAADAATARAGIEGMSKIVTAIDVLRVHADGDDVVTWFELHTAQTDQPLQVANWMHTEAGRIQTIRVTFDPRPLLA